MNKRIRPRKGFTLIELIVVIAIIGVLAAILIPTMIGYVTRSKITSANATAADMKKQIDYFLTEADVSGYGMKAGVDAVSEPHIAIVGGQWQMNIDETPLTSIFKQKDITWVATASGRRDDTMSGKNASELLLITLANNFRDVKDGYVGFRLEGGKCVALYYTADSHSAIPIQDFDEGGWKSDVYIWDTQVPGINSVGQIVGTAPVLQLGE